ncbi:hypothetical protein HDV03_003170 [Kappamyces sp. JEL0829]|nr:hypothetical protein HDV03_003170 [Kappamyces sp. JEL0829]
MGGKKPLTTGEKLYYKFIIVALFALVVLVLLAMFRPTDSHLLDIEGAGPAARWRQSGKIPARHSDPYQEIARKLYPDIDHMLSSAKHKVIYNRTVQLQGVDVYPILQPTASTADKPLENYTYHIAMGSTLLVSPKSFNTTTLSPSELAMVKQDFKFFAESRKSAHLDARYAVSFPVDAESRLIFLKGLLAAWSLFSDENELPSWMSHGNLLGWYWGQKLLTWDTDLDVQVPANLLYEMQRHNNSMVFDRYLFQINPNHIWRRNQKKNVIDARFVDTKSGFFIDITGLSNVRNTPENNMRIQCKSPHTYKYDDIFPLVRSTIDGIPVWRPNNVAGVLKGEYGAASMTNTLFEGHRFDPILQRWLPLNDCSEMYRSYIVGERQTVATPDGKTKPKYEWTAKISGVSSPFPRCRVREFSARGTVRTHLGYWSNEFQ